MDNGMPDLDRLELQARRLGLTAKKIRRMSMSDWARLTGQSLRPVEAPETVTPTPIRSESVSPPPARSEAVQDVPTTDPVSVRDMTLEEYAAFRPTVGMGQSRQYGRGIFDSVSGPRASNGRHAMVNSNVESAPRIGMDSRLEDRTSRLDNRSAAQRFSTPGNSWQG
jgi:hypothetical protein